MKTFSNKPSAVLLVVLALLVSCLGLAQTDEIDPGPRQILNTLDRLQSSPCDLDCHLEIAGLYSAEFLAAIRNAVLPGINADSHGDETLKAFFGDTLSRDQVNAMSDQELFAHQLFHTDQSVPDEYKMLQVEIISEEQISDNEIHMVLKRSGAAAFPDYEEEDFMVFIRENATWKIRQ